MRTTKKIRATFSADTNKVSVLLPHGWHELTNDELQRIYDLMQLYDTEDIRFFAFRYLSGLTVSRRQQDSDGKFFCTLKALAGSSKKGKPRYESLSFWLSGRDIVGWLGELDWLMDPGDIPVRIDHMRACYAINAKLYDVPFDTYLQIENLYQGFIASQRVDALSAIYRLLYPSGKEQWLMLSPVEITNMLHWIIQLKNLFARQFPNLFKAGGKGEAPNMLEVMNNEIRALTGGDVTKEAVVREVDTWRALTELDFKAKEADEFRREQAKIKHR